MLVDEIKIMRTKPVAETITVGEKPKVLGEISLLKSWKGIIRDRLWIWYPMVLTFEESQMKNKAKWLQVYPRVIMDEGRHFVYAGCHTTDQKVYYREILVENGESPEFFSWI